MGVGDLLVRTLAADFKRDDPIGVTVDDQCWHINLARSLRKWVQENAAMQSSVPYG